MEKSALMPIAYVARDIERALGMEPGAGYFVVTNDEPYAQKVRERYPDSILLVSSPDLLDTRELLERPETADFLEKKFGKEKPSILVFKNTSRIEEICAEKKWRLLNPSAALAEKIENKVTQAGWLGELASLLPAFSIAPLKEIVWDKKPLVIQFAHAHTGLGTILVNSEKELAALQKTFPDRPAKASGYIKGPVFTMNVAVSGRQIALGNPSYQITGLAPFTDNPFATVGNDWSATHTFLTEGKIEELRELGRKVAAKMSASGWKGLFGIDAICDEERDELKLLEINARQPASAAFESQLQEKFRTHGLAGSTISEAHLAALAADENGGGSPFPEKMIEINDGAQIVQRVTKDMPAADIAKMQLLEKAGYTVIVYQNEKPNSDLLRIQSSRGVMEKAGKLNKRGEEIAGILE